MVGCVGIGMTPTTNFETAGIIRATGVNTSLQIKRSNSTTAIGEPHVVAVSYFPNWKVRGARKIYPVTPGFMLVYPTQADVELYYGRTMADNLGGAISILTLVVLCVCAGVRARRTVSGYRNSAAARD